MLQSHRAFNRLNIGFHYPAALIHRAKPSVRIRIPVKHGGGNAETFAAGIYFIGGHIAQSYFDQRWGFAILLLRHPFGAIRTKPLDRSFGITQPLDTDRIIVSLVMILHHQMNS